jgi:MFS family permease
VTHRNGSTDPPEREDVGQSQPADPGAAGRRKAPRRSPYHSVLRLKNFSRLWIGMTIGSLGDWIALFALLSMTNRLAPGNTLAVGGLMIFRMLPIFIVGPLAGVLLDRVDRRKAMIVSNVARALLVASIPFATTLPMLYAVSFALETIALIWMPAKDSLVPTIVPNRWLVAANSLALSGFQRLRHVILPQSSRIAIPPTINQYLNYVKNTSLAMAVGYAEFASIARQAIGNGHPAPQIVLLLMAGYLIFSLTISLLVNVLNKRLQFVTN